MDDDNGKRFRKAAKKKSGDGKGFLGRATTEALECWIRQQAQEETARDALDLLETGWNIGRCEYTDRKDLYDRGTGSR